jgi:molybdopterin-containing oxidoreductase family membrane subunit
MKKIYKPSELLVRIAPQLESSSRSEKIILVILLLVFFAGIPAFYLQYTEGHVVTGMRDNVVWGIYIVNFIFYIGISYAGALISGILYLFKAEWRKPIIRIAEMITVISTILGPIYILLCMGRLDRLHHLAIYGRIQSPITWDVIAISTYLVGSIIFLYLAMIPDLAILRDQKTLKVGKWRRPFYRFFAIDYKGTPKQEKIINRGMTLMSIIIIPLAVIVHSVLSWIFGMTLRPGWHSTIFAPYFVVAAVFSGTGVLIVAMWIFRRMYKLQDIITSKHFNYLGILLLVLGALYGYFTFAEYLTGWYGSEKWELELIYKLFNPNEFGYLFYFAAFVGILVPIIIVAIPKLRTINGITIASVIVVLAMWVKRYIIIIPTLETPLLPIQDSRPEYVSYSITWVEWALTLSGLAFFCLFFYLFSKMVPIIPISEPIEKEEIAENEKMSTVPDLAVEGQLSRRKSTKMKKMIYILRFALSAFFLLSMVTFSSGQDQTEPEQRKTRLSTDLIQNKDHFLIKAVISAKKQEAKGRDYFSGMEILVVQESDSIDNVIGRGITNSAGEVLIMVEKKDDLIRNEEGLYTFEARFEGNDTLRANSSELEAKMAYLEMDFYEEDSVKMIRFTAAQFNEENEEEALDEFDVVLYSKGLFSQLKVGTSWMEGGEATMPFPVDLPGDTLGYLFLTARIEDSDEHGIIEAKGSIDWAIPKVINQGVHRGLGDTDAPLWMVYTLIILLSLVWIHYLYIIFSFRTIKKEGMKTN